MVQPQHASARSLLTGAAANLFISAAGAGLLSYPYAVLQQGIALNALLTVLFACLNAYTDLILAASAFRVRRHLKVFTYEEVCLRLLGGWGYAAAVFTVIVGCAGSIIGFMIIIGDLAQPVLSAACTSSGASTAACDVVTHRAFILIVFAAGVALPLSSFERIHSLAGSSALAALTVLVVGALMVVKGAAAAATGEEQCDGSGSPAPSPTDPTLWVRNSWTVFLGVPLSVFALGNHIQCVPVFLELGRRGSDSSAGAPAASRPRVDAAAAGIESDGAADAVSASWHTGSDNPQRSFHWVVLSSVTACVVLYTLTGAFGYVACGAATAGDILLNFPSNDAFADVARAFMAVHVTLAMPVIVVPCRRSILMLRLFVLEQWRQRQGQSAEWGRGSMSAAEATSPPLLGASDPHASALAAYAAMERSTRVLCGMGCSVQHFAWNFVLVVGGAVIAVALPQVAVVFGLLGATISTAQIYVFPALMLLALASEVDSDARAGWSETRRLGPAGRRHDSGDDSDKQRLLPGPLAAVLATGTGSGTAASAAMVRASDDGTAGDLDGPWPPHAAATGSASGAVQLEDDSPLPYVPSSPYWLRVHAFGLISVAVFIGLLGTGANIYSTWIL